MPAGSPDGKKMNHIINLKKNVTAMNRETRVVSQMLTTAYEYENESIAVQGECRKSADGGEFRELNGTVYTAGGKRTYVGRFSSSLRDGVVRYALSEMTAKESAEVWVAIDDISKALQVSDSDNATEATEGGEA